MPTKYTDTTLMPFGSKKGKPPAEISDGYLQRLYDTSKLSKALKEYIEERITVLRVMKEKNGRL